MRLRLLAFGVAVGLLALGIEAIPVKGAIAVSPARLEVEVGPVGAVREVHFINRGPDEVVLNLSLGVGLHDEAGAIVYREGEAARTIAQWVDVSPAKLRVPPGDSARATLRLQPVPGAVALYPVLFAELAPVESREAPLRSRLRLAVPMLVTFEATRSLRSVVARVRAVTARMLPDSDHLVVEVLVENTGTVHGEVETEFFAVDASGAYISRGTRSGGATVRVLPGAVRRYSAQWPVTALSRPLQIGAVLRVEGIASSPALMSLTLPEQSAERPPAAGAPSASQVPGLVVRAHWAQPDPAAGAAVVVLYDETGGELARARVDGESTPNPDGSVTVEYSLAIPEESLARVYGVGLELSEGGVNVGHAAVAADLLRGQRDELAHAAP